MTTFTPQASEAADILVDELFNDVKKWEGKLAGGTLMGDGATAVDSLRKTKVSFGDPRHSFMKLTKEKLAAQGVELSPLLADQMANTFDFYYMTLTVDMRPQPGAVFKRLTCQLDFDPQGESGTIIQSIFPLTKWRTVLAWGGSMDLALNGELTWGMGVEPSLTGQISQLPGNLQAHVANKNTLKSFVVIPEYKYEVGRFDILAQGEGNKLCYWHIEDPDLQKMPTVQFGMVFKVPQGKTTITLQGVAQADPDMQWLVANVRNIFHSLSDKMKTLLRGRDESAAKLARIAAEQWQLALPS